MDPHHSRSLMIPAKALIEPLTEHPTLRRTTGKSSPSFLLTSPSSPSFAAGVATAASCAPRRERWSLIVVGPAAILLVAVVAASLRAVESRKPPKPAYQVFGRDYQAGTPHETLAERT